MYDEIAARQRHYLGVMSWKQWVLGAYPDVFHLSGLPAYDRMSHPQYDEGMDSFHFANTSQNKLEMTRFMAMASRAATYATYGTRSSDRPFSCFKRDGNGFITGEFAPGVRPIGDLQHYTLSGGRAHESLAYKEIMTICSGTRFETKVSSTIQTWGPIGKTKQSLVGFTQGLGELPIHAGSGRCLFFGPG